METTDNPASTAAAAPRSIFLFAERFRWVICGLLFLGLTKNYVDRNVLGVLKLQLQQQFGWNDIDYGNLVTVFQVAYALGMICTGRIIDKLGTRLGYAVTMIFWSVASALHAAANSWATFAAARFALGFGEAGVFPASVKTVAEWFPKKERALSMGILNAGTSVGAIVAPLVVPWITLRFGWRWAFILVASIGMVWLVLWLLIFRRPEEHPFCTKGELELIQSDSAAPAKKIKWLALLPYRQTWTITIAKFLTDPIWFFYLFWIPDYLQRHHGLRLTQIGLPILLIYAISDAGSVFGGWLSSTLIRRGYSANAARKTAMLVSALCVAPIIAVTRVSGVWPAAFLIGLAAGGHQGFSANVFTLNSDLFPSKAVGSVSGISGMGGAVGGMLIAQVVGHVLQWTGSYTIPFFIAASAYPVALALIHLLSPKLIPAEVS